MPSHRSLSALFTLICSFISGIAVRLPGLAAPRPCPGGQPASVWPQPGAPDAPGLCRRRPGGRYRRHGRPVSPTSAATSLATSATSARPSPPAMRRRPVRPRGERRPGPRSAPGRPAQACPAQAPPATPAPRKAAPATPAPRKAAPAEPAPRKAPVKAKLAVKERNPAHRKPVHHAVPVARPYTIYDSIHPSAFPSKQSVAIYATGNYDAQPARSPARSRSCGLTSPGATTRPRS